MTSRTWCINVTDPYGKPRLENGSTTFRKRSTWLTLAQKSAEMMLKNYSILADHPICDHVILEHIEERTALFFEVLHPGAEVLDGDADRVIQDWGITCGSRSGT